MPQDVTPWKNDRWWTSPFNFRPEVREGLDLPQKVRFHDVTLRDGEQTPGVVFRKDDKVRIARSLDELGVDRIEVAMPAVSLEDADAVAAVAGLGLRAEIYAFCRATASDIDIAADCGVDGVIVEVPAGVPRLQHQFPNWGPDDVAEKSMQGIAHAKEKGLKVVFFMMDVSRGDLDFIDRLLTRVRDESPPDSVTVVDTSGCMLPRAVEWLVRHVRDLTELPVEIHTHTDLGLGVANALAAVGAGAGVVHASVLGIGERTGNAALEEVAVALRALYDCEIGIDLERLTDVAREISEISGFPRARNKPLVGTHTFVRESGMGVDLIRSQPLGLFCINPVTVGQKPGYVLGKKSGLASIAMKLEDLSLDATEEQKAELLRRVKELGIEKRAVLDDEEFRTLHKEITAGG
jgi:isopropylmalate/homocitrate/citramalate synthase